MSPEDASTGDLIRLQLLDDSRLRVSVKKIEDGVIWADHARAGSLRIPVKAVGGLVWRAPSDSRDAPSPPREQQQIPPKIQPLDRVKPDQGARAVADDRTTT